MLQISTQNAQLDIRTTSGKLSISQPPADFEMQSKQPRIIIHTELPQIQIDQRQCFNESGLMDRTALSEYTAELGRQAVMDGIARASVEGDRLANFRSKENAIAGIAHDNSFENHEFNMVTMPRSRPKIDFIGGGVDIQVEEGKVNIIFKPNSPQIDYEPGKVDVQVKQYPHIYIKYVGGTIDTKV
ncbi:MAG: DUF6470 family protein [Caulobacteraceae bacterium]